MATQLAQRQEAKGYTEVALADPQIWVKRTPSGKVTQVKARMTLFETLKEFCVIKGTPMITADGYRKLNQVTSLAVITPDSIQIPDSNGDGVRRVANPFPIIDPTSGTQRGVWVKKLAVGYSPMGSLVVSSSTLFYDFTMYFLADLQDKVKDNKLAGRMCFEHQLSEGERNKGIFLPIEGMGQNTLGIYADMENPDVLKAVGTWLQNKHFGERKAQSVCERNALKHHPALAVKLSGVQGPERDRLGQVVVVGWMHDHNRAELEEFAAAADAGKDVEVGGKSIQTIETTGVVTDEDLVTGIDDDPDVTPVDNDQSTDNNGEGLF